MFDMRIPINIVTSNEYVTSDWPKIEIVLWEDCKNYFIFAKPEEYLPKIEMPSLSWNTTSWEKKIEKNPGSTQNKPTNKNTTTPESSPYKVTPGEWEQL